jgi:hypothetical protein
MPADTAAAVERWILITMKRVRRIKTVALAVGLVLATRLLAQQVVDSSFKASVDRPAYAAGAGPRVAIDEAHDNFHTAGGQYKPLADLLTADGYRVSALAQKFDARLPADLKVLVVANARNLSAMRAGDITQPAFTDRECDALRDWVRQGGSLLLIADHAPYGHAAARLGARFGVTMGKGWTFDGTPAGEITTQLDFSRQNGLLGHHAILRGRSSSEVITHVKTFTGQSLGVPAGATILLKLSGTARDAATPDDLNAEGAATQGRDASERGKHSTSVGGRAQGLALSFGKGRVVVLGEAALLSAQVLPAADGTEMKFGMNVPGTDDRQFALNVFHWLSGILQ